MWKQAPGRKCREEYSEEAVCPVFYSSPPTTHHPQHPRGGSGPQMPRGTSGSGPLEPSMGRSPSTGAGGGGGSGVLDAVSDRASLADDYSLPSSPAHSVYSDLNPGSNNASPLHNDFRQRRISLDQASEMLNKGPAALTRGERKGFLSKDQMHLTPMRAGSPLFESGGSNTSASAFLGGSMLFAGSPSAGNSTLNRYGSPGGTPRFAGSPSASSTGGGAGSECGSPLFPSLPFNSSSAFRTEDHRSGSPLFAPHVQHSVRGGSATASPVHHRNTSGLREQVLIRSSSGQSTELARVGSTRSPEEDMDFPELVEAECLNLSETESVCQEKELEKETLDGMLIVPLPNHLSLGAAASEHVLYALFFSSQSQTPLLPGDDSVRLLFPKRLQDEADGAHNRTKPRKPAPSAAFFECKPYKAPQKSAPAVSRGTPIAMFGQYKALNT